MARRRKPGKQKQHTISCRDVEWESVRKRAHAAGMSISRFLVSRALEVEIITDAGGRRRMQPRLVLSEEEQVEIPGRVAQIAERMAGPANAADLEGFHSRVKFILAATMDDMVEGGRTQTMTAILVEILGPEKGEKVAANFVARVRRRARPG